MCRCGRPGRIDRYGSGGDFEHNALKAGVVHLGMNGARYADMGTVSRVQGIAEEWAGNDRKGVVKRTTRSRTKCKVKVRRSRVNWILPLACVAVALFACAKPDAQLGTQPRAKPLVAVQVLGTAQSFRVLGGSTVTNTGPTTISGDLGVAPGLAITGFPPGLVIGGATHAGDAVALQAQNDVTTAYNTLAGQACDVDLTGQDLGGLDADRGRLLLFVVCAADRRARSRRPRRPGRELRFSGWQYAHHLEQRFRRHDQRRSGLWCLLADR